VKNPKLRHRPGIARLIGRDNGDRNPAGRGRLQINSFQPGPELLDQRRPHRVHHRPVNPAHRGYQHVGRTVTPADRAEWERSAATPEPPGYLNDRHTRPGLQDGPVTLLDNRQLHQCQSRPPGA
jgi:hypothetical protein